MVLKTHRWGAEGANCVVCVHGVTQHGRIFDGLARRLAERGKSVLAVDLRGHGSSGRKPPWNTDTHVNDLLETIDAAEVERVSWIGHSFGGRLVAEATVRAVERTDGVVLLDPGLEVPTDRALRSAEIDRLDWSFATTDGALNALLSSDAIVAAPRDVVAEYVRDDIRKGPDGRFRFGFCPSAAVVAWSEMTLPPPAIAQLPTLIVRAAAPLFDWSAGESRYRKALGRLLTVTTVPNGHNVLWESASETTEAIERFFGSAPPPAHPAEPVVPLG
ncbi:MAG TPA: alpha/beta fold hydrolase [Solirubrobacterales bacterium]|jgi:lipase|nr:alpha/beta fold hydrolase [Solirubrobacterales bacterium]